MSEIEEGTRVRVTCDLPGYADEGDILICVWVSRETDEYMVEDSEGDRFWVDADEVEVADASN